MTWLALAAAAIKSLPLLLNLISQFKASAEAKVQRGIGYDEAVADGLKLMTKQLAEIDEAVGEARARQSATPGDDGRDTEFRRD